MFVRKLKHPNGKIYVQIVQKQSGKYLVKKRFGSASKESTLHFLVNKAENWIRQKSGMQEFDFSNSDVYIEQFFNSISSIERTGYDLLIGSIFDEIGFGKIDTELFRELVIARVAFPKSKSRGKNNKTHSYCYVRSFWFQNKRHFKICSQWRIQYFQIKRLPNR